jgi:hypothetical protein
MDVNSLNRGRLRHPLFGNRNHWYDIRIRPGFINVAADQTFKDVRREVLKAIDRSTAQLRARR